MAPNTLTEPLKLPPGDRAELAMALWASLDDAARGAELAITPEQITELDRRFAEHQANPASARSWDEVEKNLGDRRRCAQIPRHGSRSTQDSTATLLRQIAATER